MGVGLHVVEDFVTRVLVVGVGGGAEGVCFGVGEVGGLADLFFGIDEDGFEAAAVEVARGGFAEEVGDSGEEVGELGEGGGAAGGVSGGGDDEGDPADFFVEIEFFPEFFFAEVVAVVGEEDDGGGVSEFEAVEFGKDAADLVVNELDAGIVAGPHVFLVIDGVVHAIDAAVVSSEGFFGEVVAITRVLFGWGDFFDGVGVEVFLRCKPWGSVDGRDRGRERRGGFCFFEGVRWTWWRLCSRAGRSRHYRWRR